MTKGAGTRRPSPDTKHQTGRAGTAQTLSPRQNVTKDPSKLNGHRGNAVGPACPEGLGKGVRPSEQPVFLRDSGNRIGASAMGLDGSSLDGSKRGQRTNSSGSFGDGPVQDTGRVGTVCQTLKFSGSWDQEKVRRSATAQGIPQVPFSAARSVVDSPSSLPYR